MLGEIIEFFIIKQIKEASTELCSVVKHLGSGRALKKWGKTLDCVSCFPLHFFRALPLPACFTTEQSAVEASLFVNWIVNPTLFASHKSVKSHHGTSDIPQFQLGNIPSCDMFRPIARRRKYLMDYNFQYFGRHGLPSSGCYRV